MAEKANSPAATTVKCDCCGGRLEDASFCVDCAVESGPDVERVFDPLWDGDPRRADTVLVQRDVYRSICRTCCACFLAPFVMETNQPTGNRD